MRALQPLQIATSSADATRDVAERIGGLVRAGDLVLLGGELGAGKTTFTQGLARALGVAERVTSPTFTLVHSYEGRGLRLLHADVYRLGHLQEVIDLGLPELLEEEAAAVVEWGDLAAPVLLPDHLNIRMFFGPGDDDRVMELEPVGEHWQSRLPALRELIEKGCP
jgi:tRNA threonylcarbamoyladenosine biosynthesis protein TsaE